MIAVRVGETLVRAVDQYARAVRSSSRSDALRALLLAGLGVEAKRAGAGGDR